MSLNEVPDIDLNNIKDPVVRLNFQILIEQVKAMSEYLRNVNGDTVLICTSVEVNGETYTHTDGVGWHKE